MTGAKDARGNDQKPYTPEGEFVLDTINPTVKSVVANVAGAATGANNQPTISDSDVASSSKLDVTVTFSEDMDQTEGSVPVLKFSVAEGTLGITKSGGVWLSSTQYKATYDVVDKNAFNNGVTIDVEGARDDVGNPQQDYTAQTAVNFDTKNPTLTIAASSKSQEGGFYSHTDFKAGADVITVSSDAVISDGKTTIKASFEGADGDVVQKTIDSDGSSQGFKLTQTRNNQSRTR